nr:hypothetical protein [Tanacetum cinerariifolium]GFA00102.1 hypothetical protein [Tanacetum cinerariifolium]
KKGGVINSPLAQPATYTSSRQLSVQDRINIFKNKQKEGGSATRSGAKLVATKPELRRLSFDISHLHSAVPLAVLRRLSGATDTSIDLSGDKKEDHKDIPISVITESDDNSLTVSQVNDFDGSQEEQVCKSDQLKFGSSTVGSLEQDTRLGGSGLRQLKGNQELNVELKVKANEFKKLFAEHKLRVLGDQPNPTRQSKASDLESDQTMRLAYMKQVTDPIPKQQRMFESPIPVMDSGGRNHNRLLQVEVELSDDSRGKLYDNYMKKRDARLRESWDSNRAEKKRMKAMNDSLERHSTKMKATFFSWSKDRQNSVSSAQRRVEKLSSESVILTPTNEGHMKSSKNVETRRFLRKNTGIGPNAGSVAAKMKALMVSETMSKDEEYDKPVSKLDVKVDGLKELDTTETKD